MSGINQMLTPHIQDWDMYPFSPCPNLVIVLLRLFFFLCCAPISDSWRIVLEPCWKNMAVWKVQRPYTENPKSTMLKLVYLSHFITVLFSRMCCRSALRGCPLAESKDKETVTFTVCHRAGNNAVTENAAGQGERDSCGRVRRLFF